MIVTLSQWDSYKQIPDSQVAGPSRRMAMLPGKSKIMYVTKSLHMLVLNMILYGGSHNQSNNRVSVANG